MLAPVSRAVRPAARATGPLRCLSIARSTSSTAAPLSTALRSASPAPDASWRSLRAAAPQLRCLSTAAADAPEPDDDPEAMALIYEGPMNGVVKRIKLVSVTTLSSSLLMPAMAVLFKSSESVSALGKLAVGGTAVFAGVGSTFALHWCTLPFVFELRSDGERVRATRMNLLARRTTHDFSVADIERQPTTWRPFVSFEAKGTPFFVTKSGFLDEKDADRYGAE